MAFQPGAFRAALHVSQLLAKPALLAALPYQTKPVKVLRKNDSTLKVTPAQALLMVRLGVYEGGCNSTGRIKYIREIDQRSACVRDDRSWRTSKASILPPGPEYFARMNA